MEISEKGEGQTTTYVTMIHAIVLPALQSVIIDLKGDQASEALSPVINLKALVDVSAALVSPSSARERMERLPFALNRVQRHCILNCCAMSLYFRTMLLYF